MKLRYRLPYLAIAALFFSLAEAWAQVVVEPDSSAVEQIQALIPPPQQGGTHANPAYGSGAQPTLPKSQHTPPRGPLLTSDGVPIFGSQLFQGDFRDASFNGFNPDYQISVGDVVQVMLWGGLETMLQLPVDAQGNIFVPKIGPVPVLGVRNADLNQIVNQHIRRIYKENVDAYANLRSTQTVKVFVSGFVMKPGLFQGFASDSALYYLDRAGGIDPERGSFLDISVIRSGQRIATLNLYDFMQKGSLPITQFRDGDVILVGPLTNTVVIQGEVNNSGRFEFTSSPASLEDLLALAAPRAAGTHLSIRRAVNGAAEAIVFPIEEAKGHTVEPGDFIEVTTRNVPKSILITVAGEHLGPQRIVLPYGAALADGIREIKSSPRSRIEAVQLFRKSVAERQKALLNQSLDNLERNVLNIQAVSYDEARLRVAESQLILSFIKKAREVEPKGQVLLEGAEQSRDIILEDGDTLYVPATSSLVTVYGEVKFPNTQSYRSRDSISDYVARAGGYTNRAEKSDIIIIQPNGTIVNAGSGRSYTIGAGDEIIVLPKPDRKGLMFAKDISTILYQIAVAARVVISL